MEERGHYSCHAVIVDLSVRPKTLAFQGLGGCVLLRGSFEI